MKPLAIGGIITIVIGVLVAFSVSNEQQDTSNIESKVLGEITQTEVKNDDSKISDIPDLPFDARILAMQIHNKTNEVRVENGLKPLEWNDRIASVASSYSQRMVDLDFYSHDDPFTNESSVERGIKSGFTDCGDPETIQLGKDIDAMQSGFDKNFEEYEKKVDRYNYLIEYYTTFGQDNISVYNEMVALQKELQTIEPRVTNGQQQLNNMIDEFNQRVDNDRIFSGFGENLMMISGYKIGMDLPFETVNGWWNSPGHRDNMLTGAWHKEGIGVAVKPDNSIIVTANYC